MLNDDWSGSVRVAVAGQLILKACSGDIAAGSARPVTAEFRFQAGSISKTLVAVVTLQLVEQQVLGLHEPVGRWLPAVPPAWTPITVHHLLTHTSGLGHWADVPGLDISKPPARDELDAMIAAAPLVDRPGARWCYSGPGYLLLAATIEAVTKRPYGDVVHQSVFTPAGMAATTSGQCPLGLPDVAAGQHHGSPVEVATGLTAMPGTGDLWTTTGDLIAFARTMRSGSLLRPDSLATLRTRHADLPALPTGPAQLIRPTAYGYGTFLGAIAGRPAHFHPGDNPGYTSLLAWLPDEDVDLAVLCNDDGPPLEQTVRSALDTALGNGKLQASSIAHVCVTAHYSFGIHTTRLAKLQAAGNHRGRAPARFGTSAASRRRLAPRSASMPRPCTATSPTSARLSRSAVGPKSADRLPFLVLRRRLPLGCHQRLATRARKPFGQRGRLTGLRDDGAHA